MAEQLSEQKLRAREMWAAGDYASTAGMIAAAGRTAVEAGGVGAGDVVLDVACGSGNATIPAARAGASVTGLDLTPRLLEEGRERAAAAGVEIAWVEGDAERLPFDDGSFDVVLSVFGCMFAPDQGAAAGEIARVIKPGGRMAVCAWTPDGNVGRFFMAVGKHMPPPPEGFKPPVLWGDEAYVRGLFAGSGLELSFHEDAVEFAGESAEDFLAGYERTLPPLVAARAVLEPQGKWDALREELLGAYEEMNLSTEGDYRAVGEYLVITGTKPA